MRRHYAAAATLCIDASRHAFLSMILFQPDSFISRHVATLLIAIDAARLLHTVALAYFTCRHYVAIVITTLPRWQR